jgi:uncharacterized protein (TIGR03086 family)
VIEDPRPLHAHAAALADAVVRQVAMQDLGRPTPCAGWDLAALLAHMIGQQRGFARALATGDAPESAYAPEAFSASGWSDSLAALSAAVAVADLAGVARVSELAPVAVPVRSIVRAQLLDTVVHTWDVAEALGVAFVPPEHLAAEVAAIAESVPDSSRGPGRAFGPALGSSGSPWDRTLALLGRAPGSRGRVRAG